MHNAISVQSEGLDLQVCKQSHTERSQSGDGGSCGDKVSLDLGGTEGVIGINGTDGISLAAVTDASTTRVGNDGSIDSDNIGHGKEGGNTTADFSEEAGALAFLALPFGNPRLAAEAKKGCLGSCVQT